MFYMDPIRLPWLILLAYWVIAFFRVRPNQTVEPLPSRLIRLAVIVVGFELLYGHWLRFTILGRRFVPDLPPVRYAGIILLWLGIGIAIWARYYIGEYWSAKITIKTEHKVIDSGPYAFMRHPIYSGILLAFIGTALAIGRWRGVAAFFLMLVVFIIKARREESLLTAELGDNYGRYKKRTGMLIPWIG